MRKKPLALPEASIRWYVGKYHVSTPDTDIRQAIRGLCVTSVWTEKDIIRAENYAVKCHKENRDLYTRVMSGRL